MVVREGEIKEQQNSREILNQKKKVKKCRRWCGKRKGRDKCVGG